MRSFIIAKFSRYLYRNNVIISDSYIIKKAYRTRSLKLT